MALGMTMVPIVFAVALRLFDINAIVCFLGDESRVMSKFFSCFCNQRPVSQAFYREFVMRRYAELPFSVCFFNCHIVRPVTCVFGFSAHYLWRARQVRVRVSLPPPIVGGGRRRCG